MTMSRLTCTQVILLVCCNAIFARAHSHLDDASKNLTNLPECGEINPNGNFIDQSEPEKPGPFHDLTSTELRKLREFLEKDPNIQAVKSSNATLNSSYIFTADLLLPKKTDVLDYLDRNGAQPIRQAKVIMFRGDKYPPVVEEYVCGPLPDISKCELINKTNSVNPVPFCIRPLNGLEIKAIKEVLLEKVDEKVGAILMESYGAKFTGCAEKKACLSSTSAPVGTGILEDMKKRLMWVTATYNLPYKTVHTLDFAVLVNFNDTDASNWTIEKVWYSSKLYDSLEELVEKYNNGSISKTKITKPADDDTLFSSLRRRGDPQPHKPQRPPRLVEPDGKRYTVKQRKVEYMGWSFHYRLSPLTGPAIYDVRYKGERIIYELSLAQIAVLYSGFAPFGQTLNDVDASRMLGSRSKAFIKGGDCPESATLLKSVFMSQYSEEPAVYDYSLCLFEIIDGHAMRQHHAYTTDEGGFFGAMMDTQLILRTIITDMNNDYMIEYLIHQNGVVHARFMNTGYLQTSFFSTAEKPYGHRIQKDILGNIRQTLVGFKVDLDIGGSTNRYETLKIVKENINTTAFPDQLFSQTRINSTLKTTEKDAVVDFNFSSPAYHIVHNIDKKNAYNESKAYRIELRDMSKNIREQDVGNDKSISWARHQMVVTKHKDDESTSSSIYAMLDSYKPTVDFKSFYEDDEDIVDKDLVFWITSGTQQIPHTENLPNTPTIDRQLSFFLLPHNYFPECPSMGSRDAIIVEYKDPKDPSKGVKVDRNGNSRDQCVVPKSTLEEDLEANPDRILESRRRNPTDF